MQRPVRAHPPTPAAGRRPPGPNPDRATTLTITCAKAMPPILASELRTLGYNPTAELDAGVEISGTLADAMRLNLYLRTAHRVLYRLSEVIAPTPDALHAAVSRLPWENLLAPGAPVCVRAAVEDNATADARFAALKCKDAIVDRIRARTGKRPDSGPDPVGAVIFLYWRGERARVYLDTSGEPLTRRGYRTHRMEAPLQETLAAGVLLATGWDGSVPLANPMCGSGTLAIEAALIALRRAPGLLRQNFGFMHLAGYDASAWRELQRQAAAAALPRTPAPIFAGDIDPAAIETARHNARTAGVEQAIRFDVCDYATGPLPDGTGVVVINPPYGERMGDAASLEPLYRGIGDFLKQRCQGWRGYVLTGNLALGKGIGLRTSRRIPFFNSRIECRLLEFQVYAGSRRQDPPPPPSDPSVPSLPSVPSEN